MLSRLPRDAVDLIVERSGPVTARDLADLGATRPRIARWLDRRLLVTLADGVYTDARLRARLDDWTWFALRSQAFVIASPPDSVAGSWSAIVLDDLPTLGRPPVLPCVIRAGRPPRGSERSPSGWTRFATVPDDLTAVVSGVRALIAPIAVIDVGRRASRLATLVLADGVALRQGTIAPMLQGLDLLHRWPRVGRAKWAVVRADAECESPLETIGRYAVIAGGLPPPRSNVWVGIGEPRYRIDQYWAGRRFGLEGDGLEKYTLDGAGRVHDLLLHEKDREIEMRGWGVSIERYLWRSALFGPRALAARCDAGLARPMLPAHPGLEWWPAEVGFRMLGLATPRHRARKPGWMAKVTRALGAIGDDD